jgi:hypothetical protein
MTHRALGLERGRAPGIDGSAARPRGSPAAGPPPPRACRIPPGLPTITMAEITSSIFICSWSSASGQLPTFE